MGNRLTGTFTHKNGPVNNWLNINVAGLRDRLAYSSTAQPGPEIIHVVQDVLSTCFGKETVVWGYNDGVVLNGVFENPI